MSTLVRRSALLCLGTLVGALLSGVAIRVLAQAPDTYMTGCLRSNGTLNRVNIGIAPTSPCSGGDTLVRFNLAQAQVGAGLIGGGATGDFEISADTSFLQKRVATPCPPGESIRAIDEDGVPTCEAGSEGPPSWRLDGNAGTDSSVNFLGTSDDEALVVRTGNVERLRITENGDVGIGVPAPGSRLDLGGEAGAAVSVGTTTTLLNAGTPNQGHSQFSSTWDDNFHIRTFDNTPNPNFVLGIGDGAGDFAHMPIFWNEILVLNGSGRSWCRTCGVPVSPARRADVVIDEQGRVGIGTINPRSSLQVNGYVQLAIETAPPPADCDEAAERGRTVVDSVNGLLYICVDAGWVAK